MLNCKDARRIKKIDKCCRGYICLDDLKEQNPERYKKLIKIESKTDKKFNINGEIDAAYTIQKSQMRNDCIVQIGNWTRCSRLCGWGLSERVHNDNEDCIFQRDVRLCKNRECDESDRLNFEMVGNSVPTEFIRETRDSGFTPKAPSPLEFPGGRKYDVCQKNGQG